MHGKPKKHCKLRGVLLLLLLSFVFCCCCGGGGCGPSARPVVGASWGGWPSLRPCWPLLDQLGAILGRAIYLFYFIICFLFILFILFILFMYLFLRQVLFCFWLPGSMLSCFSDFLLLCFSACLLTLLLCFSCFSVFLLFAFPASLLFLLLCFSAFCFSCFFAFLLLCFPCFIASLLLYFCAFLLLLFYFFFSSVMCFCCSTSCSFASLLPVFTVSLFFMFFCFILFRLYPTWNPRETLGEIQRNPQEILIRNPIYMKP